MASLVDELENHWGVQLFVLEPQRTPGKSSKEFDKVIRKSVPGFQLYKVQSAGTYGNMIAVQDATDYDVNLALYAVGSYVGGDALLQEISTTAYDPSCCISTPKYVENASDRCFAQSAPLPYAIPGGIDEDALLDLEDDCLRCLHKILIMRRMTGQKPFRALLLELLLGGNGATLSDRFLEKLGTLCLHQGVAIIVDEVLTGGRNGEQMVMTLSTPKTFQAAVQYITMGKFLGCALVLKKIPTKPTSQNEKLRGTSTDMDCGKPFALWMMTQKAISAKAVSKRRKDVLSCFKITNEKDAWGIGCLIFSIYKRPQTMTALKNRMLPMLQPGMKIRKQSAIKSKYTRVSVTETVTGIIVEWILRHNKRNETVLRYCFVSPLVDMLFSTRQTKLEGQNSEEAGYFRLRADDVITYLGKKRSEEMAVKCREQKIEQGAGVCRMKPLQFAREALLVACKQTFDDGTRIAYKKKKTSSRTEFTFVSAKLFGALDRRGALTFHS